MADCDHAEFRTNLSGVELWSSYCAIATYNGIDGIPSIILCHHLVSIGKRTRLNDVVHRQCRDEDDPAALLYWFGSSYF